MFSIHVAALLECFLLHHLYAQEPPNPEVTTEKTVVHKQNVQGARDLHPYVLPDEFVTEIINFRSGYMNEKPVYATIYSTVKEDIHFYIFPPNHCQAVWLCLADGYGTSTTGYFQFTLGTVCSESLRFFPLEQVVYHTKNNAIKAYPYYSTLVELIHQFSSEVQQKYIFKPYQDFDAEDFGNVQRGPEIELLLAGRRLVLLTSSPYCHATIQQPFLGSIEGYSVVFWPQDKDSYYDSPYFQGGGDPRLEMRAQIWINKPSISFDPRRERAGLKKAKIDCCPPTWEFEGFVTDTEWNTVPRISYHKYTLQKKNVIECFEHDKKASRFQSILIEVGQKCEWMRLCFDTNEKDFCKNDGNTLAFIFVHDVYIPTDSGVSIILLDYALGWVGLASMYSTSEQQRLELFFGCGWHVEDKIHLICNVVVTERGMTLLDEARPLGLHRDEIDSLRLNFIIGWKGLELAYGFSNSLEPGIVEYMRLYPYDGVNPSNIVINVVKAPHCEGRLTNDLASTNLRDGNEVQLQCLSISSCQCLET
ncbi:hypothetical protein RB195_007342 [Necator americanus]|uniref:Uncharacterized protein n=1 Tax=Necator americanus TaxID=51031 RepID=A0ABR1BZD0_NECAM